MELSALFAAAREHKLDVVFLILTATLSSDARDWLESVAPDYPFEIYSWEEGDLEQEVRKHRRNLTIMPKIVPQDREPARFVEIQPGDKIYMSDTPEFEEVDFYLLNSHGPAIDKKILEEFVEFIRHNDAGFFGDEEKNEDEDSEESDAG